MSRRICVGLPFLVKRFRAQLFLATVAILFMTTLGPALAAQVNSDFVWVNRASAQTTPPDADELSKYLIIGMGKGSSATVAISDAEEGADQEVVSTSDVGSPSQTVFEYTGGLSLFSTIITNLGWTDVDANHPNDTVGIPDRLIGPDANNPVAPAVFEGIDYSGNIALTSANGDFNIANSDIWATIGVDCANNSLNSCEEGASNSDWIPWVDNMPLGSGSGEGGVNNFDPADLKAEIVAWRNFINDDTSLPAEATIVKCGSAAVRGPSNPFPQGVETSYCTEDGKISNFAYSKGVGVPLVFDLDKIDADNDGFAVIDINLADKTLLLDNTDWILRSSNQQTIAIFRFKNNSDVPALDISNGSILYGDHTSDVAPQKMGAIFAKLDGHNTDNANFALSNAILSGIALWDLGNVSSTTVSDNGNTEIDIQDGQGCAQFLGQTVIHGSSNRWNRCAPANNSCTGVTITATVCEDENMNGVCDAGEPHFTNPKLDIPIELVPDSPTDANPILIGSTNYQGEVIFKSERDGFTVPGDYSLQINDAYLIGQSYYATTATSHSFSVAACTDYKREFAYAEHDLGTIGDLIWYDADNDTKQDEWLDHNENNKVDEYILGLPIPLREYEWIDVNGNGSYGFVEADGSLNDLGEEGEVNRCGISGVTVTLDDSDQTAYTNLLGYYRFYQLPLEATYSTSISEGDSKLIDGATEWFDINEDDVTGKCASNIPNLTAVSAASRSYSPIQASAVNDASCNLTSNDSQDSDQLTETNDTDLKLDYAIVCTNGPLAVTLSDFKAQRQGGAALLSWTTATETGNAGFNLYVEAAGGLELLNQTLIPSTVIDSVTPTSYRYVAQTSGNLFHIELVGIDGAKEKIGPFASVESESTPQINVDSSLWIPMVTR